jgi:hypothetical protein
MATPEELKAAITRLAVSFRHSDGGADLEAIAGSIARIEHNQRINSDFIKVMLTALKSTHFGPLEYAVTALEQEYAIDKLVANREPPIKAKAKPESFGDAFRTNVKLFPAHYAPFVHPMFATAVGGLEPCKGDGFLLNAKIDAFGEFLIDAYKGETTYSEEAYASAELHEFMAVTIAFSRTNDCPLSFKLGSKFESDIDPDETLNQAIKDRLKYSFRLFMTFIKPLLKQEYATVCLMPDYEVAFITPYGFFADAFSVQVFSSTVSVHSPTALRAFLTTVCDPDKF